jgi:hypothetical protein
MGLSLYLYDRCVTYFAASVPDDVDDEVLLGARFEFEHGAVGGEVAGEVLLDGVEAEEILESQLVEFSVGHVLGPLHLLPLVQVAVDLLDVRLDLALLLHYLHLGQDVLDLLNVQQIAAVLVRVQESHRRLRLEGVELVQTVKVQLSLTHEQHQSDLQLLLLEISPAGKRKGVQCLRVENDVMVYVWRGVQMPNSRSCDSVEYSESVILYISCSLRR